MAEDAALLTSLEDGVLWLRLHRPDARNAIDPAMREGLFAAFTRADEDDAVRAVAIIGEGTDFCVGADLGKTPDLAGAQDSEHPDPFFYRRFPAPYIDLFRRMWQLETPVVTAVRGRVAGTGWLLALLADLVVAADDARWTHVFLRRGMTPHGGDPFYLPRIIPFHRLNEIVMLGDTVSSTTLHSWGVLNRVVPAEEVEQTARELALRLAAGPTKSIGQAKRLYRRSLECDLETELVEEAYATALLSQTHDRLEGVRSLMEGRRPSFEGR